MRYIFVFVFAFLVHYTSFGIDAFVDVKKFNGIDNNPFVELQILIPGKSLVFAPAETGKFKAAVEVLILIKQGEVIEKYDKYILNSTELENENEYVNLLDLKRFSLKTGDYDLELTFTDEANKEINTEIKHNFSINFPEDSLSISDITLAEKISQEETENIYSKSGYEIIPSVINFYSGKQKELGFYAEVYGADKALAGEDAYMISYAVMDVNNQKVVNGLRKFKKANPAPIEVAMAVFNIEDLPSGNYNFMIEVRNKKNELLESKFIGFQRSKPVDPDATIEEINQNVDIENTFVKAYNTVDSLYFYLGSLLPISEVHDYEIIELAMESKKVNIMQQVLYNYCTKIFPLNTSDEFDIYKKVVLTVDDKYRTLTAPGHETDRGRVFLKYGQPTEIIIGQEPGTLPYELWTYNEVTSTNQTNVKTIFYNPNIGTNTYPILHSEIRGEITNDRWELELYLRDSKNFDDTGNSRRSFGAKAPSIFNEFSNPKSRNSSGKD